MLAALAMAVLAGPTDFKGGDATDLAQAIASKAGSAMFAVFERKDYPAFKFDASRVNDLLVSVKAATGLVMSGGTRPIFHPGTIPKHLVELPMIMGQRPGGFSWVSIPPEAIKDGKITWETKKGQAVRASSLRDAPWSKPLRVHWFYEEVPLVFKVVDMAEVEFQTYAAKALGAQLSVSKGENGLDFNPAEVRSRTRRTFQEKLKGPEYGKLEGRQKTEIDLARAALDMATDDQLRQAFASRGSSARIVAGLWYANLIWSRLEQASNNAYQADDQQGRYRQGGQGQARDAGPQIDPQSPVFFVLRSNFQTHCEATALGANGRRGSVIRF